MKTVYAKLNDNVMCMGSADTYREALRQCQLMASVLFPKNYHAIYFEFQPMGV